MSAQPFKPHEAARPKSGAMAGMVGTVIEVKPGARGQRVRVLFEGINEGKPYSKALNFDGSKLEHAA